MKIKIISIIISILIILLTIIFLSKSKFLFLVIGIAVIIALLPFLISLLIQESREKEKEEFFLEFSRNLAESIKSGQPLSKAIINTKDKDYGPLNKNIKKLASQVELGIPVKQALQTFSKDLKNKVISKSINLIVQAENAGGEISSILDSVVSSISQIEEIKKERASKVYSLIAQGYILFFIFLVIMLFTQLKFIPLIFKSFSSTSELTRTDSLNVVNRSFFILILIQAFFTGLVIGKLGEGRIRAGIKHSAILVFIAFLFLALSKILT